MISGLTSPSHGVRALLVATCVCTGVTYGQGPTVTARTLVHQFGPNGPAGSAIPGPFAIVTTGARYSPSSVLVGLGDRRCFLADGASVRPVMVSGSQIPGQAPGVVWGGQFASAVWPIPGGAAFSAWASGPGIGDTARPIMFVGDVEQPGLVDPLRMGPSPTTVTGVTLINAPDAWAAVGPPGGPGVTLVPRSYQPPGATAVSLVPASVQLNNAGAVSLTLEGNVGGTQRWFAIVADTGSIRVLATSGETIQSVRGPIATSTGRLGTASQPFSNGSVFVQGTALIASQNRSALWLARPSGLASVVAIAGDRALGTEPGVMMRAAGVLDPLAANRHGSMLFLARLEGPGVDASNDAAIYLWRDATLTLVARSSLSSLYLPVFGGAVAINSHNDVGIITQTQALLYKPGVGTVVVARLNQPLNPSSGLGGDVLQLSSFFGSLSNTSTDAGNDNLALSCLSEAGELLVFGSNGSAFAINFSITDAGCPSDFNLDGFTDFFDYLDYVTCFEGGRCPDGKVADFNDDGIADFFDYMGFVEAFETGC